MPRVLVLTADMSLPEAMSAFRLTRNEFAVVVEQPGVETPERSAAGAGQDISGGDGGEAQALLAEVKGKGGSMFPYKKALCCRWTPYFEIRKTLYAVG